MGFRMRKSINLGGGFKINLSKSGVGYSWGVPGYRITKTAKGTIRKTYSIPGTGLSYVDESGNNLNRGRKPTSRNNPSNAPQPIEQPEPTRNVESAAIESFKAAEIGNITSAIEKTILLNKWSTALIICAILIPLHPLFTIIPIIGIVLKVMARKTGAVQLEYTLDEEKGDEYKRRIGAWEILAEGDKQWQVIQESQVVNQKINAGADRNINRVICNINKATPFYINTNVDTIQIKLQNEVLIFLPDKVFIIRGGRVGLINYDEVSICVSRTRFIESDPVPKDAVVVGNTWQYVNKNGTPDRRYSNNRQLPICQYGVVYITSQTGLNVEMQFSNVNKTQDFEELL